MIAAIKKQAKNLQQMTLPYWEISKKRWLQLQPREKQLLILLSGFLALFLMFVLVGNLIRYKSDLENEVHNLAMVSSYSERMAITYQAVNKIQANSFSQVNLKQVKGDIAQVLQVKDPNILIQDGQMTMSFPLARFEDVVTILEQFRRSYGLFPSQVNLISLPQSGYVSFSATFWVNQ